MAFSKKPKIEVDVEQLNIAMQRMRDAMTELTSAIHDFTVATKKTAVVTEDLNKAIRRSEDLHRNTKRSRS